MLDCIGRDDIAPKLTGPEALASVPPSLAAAGKSKSKVEVEPMPELGNKHECPECGAKYYDLGKSDATCPRCVPEEEPAPEEQEKDNDSKK